MNISQEDKYTPIRLLPNSALHMNGANRPIGLFCVGNSGLRIFCPNPVASSFVSVGGMSILLCLVAMVNELSELYASLKALTCILQSSKIARKEMKRVEGYQVGFFIKMILSYRCSCLKMCTADFVFAVKFWQAI